MSIRTKLCAIAASILFTSMMLPSWSLAASKTSDRMILQKYHFVSSAVYEGAAAKELRKFADSVIQELSQQELFKTWSGADTLIEPLGPGTHSWLITIQDSSERNNSTSSSGYLIISVAENGEYKLVEYGLGPDSIFAKSTLENALVNSGLKLSTNARWSIIPVYSGPVLAEWALSKEGVSRMEHFLDARTGELLPENEESFTAQASRYIPPATAAGGSQALPDIRADRLVFTSDSFDPYDNILWMADSGAINVISETFEKVLLNNKKLVFVSSGKNRTYSVPLPIFGYQKWSRQDDSTLYMMSGSESSPRFISLQALTDSGKFIKYN
ncbi:hypothetical protein D3C76_63500 [compost metagenome]